MTKGFFMKKQKIIIPLLITLFSSKVYSSLPDEINYPPYKVKYERLSSQVDVITQKLEDAKQELEWNYNQEANFYNNIQKLEADNEELRTQIQNNNQRRSDLIDYIDRLDNILATLNRDINSLERQRNQTERQIISEERRLTPYITRVNRLQTRLEKINTEVKQARRRVNRAKKVSSSLRSELQSLQRERKNLAEAIKGLKEQLATLDEKITQKENNLSELPAKINKKTSQLERQKTQKEKLKVQLSKLQEQLKKLMQEDRSNPAIRELRAKVAQKAKDLDAKKTQITRTQKQLNQLKSQEQSLESQIAKLKQQKQKLPQRIKSSEASLKTKKALIATKKTEVGNAETKTAEATSQLDKVAQESNRVQNRLQNARQDLARESRKKERLLAHMRQLTQEIRVLDQDILAHQDNLSRANSEVIQIDQQTPQLERTISLNTDQLAQLERDLVLTQDKIKFLSRDINELTSQQTQRVAQRDIEYENYLSRLNQYNEKLSQAKQIGASQTDIAYKLAVKDGNAYVQQRADSLGTDMGLNLANAQAKLWATVRAEVQGYNDGYEQGYASTADQSRGEEEGTQAGIRAAKDYAQRVLKPQFFNEFFAKKLEAETVQTIKVNESLEESFERVEIQKRLTDILAGVEPISANELQESLEIKTQLDNSITEYQSNLTLTLEEKENLALAQNSYQSPQQIPYQSVDCSSVYKGVSDFVSACQKNYQSVFADKYTQEFYQTYSAQYTVLYEQSLEETRAQNIQQLYDKNYAEAYPIAQDKGIAVGKADIYQNSYNMAKVAAYETQLPQSRAQANLEAQTEVSQWINSNATLTLKQAKIVDSDLRGGSRAKLNLRLKNISPEALKRPVKVVVTSTQNTQLANKTFYLKQAKGLSTVDFKDISFRINPNATSGQKIKLKGKIYLAGGKYNEQRIENFSAEATTALNPAITTNLNYDSSPRIVTIFRRRTLIHSLNIKASPKFESIPDNYTVKISALPDSQEYIEFKNTTAKIGSIRYGQEKSTQFRYTFWLAGEGKKVQIKLDYQYQGKTIKSEIIDLYPH